MENLIIHYSNKDSFVLTPKVHLDVQSGVCAISGKSFLVDPKEFYQPVLSWIEEYMHQKKGALYWYFHLEFGGVGTKKMLVGLLKMLKQYQRKRGVVSVEWLVHFQDVDLIEEINELAEISGVPIDILLLGYSEKEMGQVSAA